MQAEKKLRKYFRNGPRGRRKRFENIFVMVRAGRENKNQFLRAARAPAAPRAPPNRGPRGTQKLVRTTERFRPSVRTLIPYLALRKVFGPKVTIQYYNCYAARRGGGSDEGGISVGASTPVGPRTWLRLARNFAKTRFRRSPSIQFSTKIFFSARFFGLGNRFLLFWEGFGASSEKQTSKSTSSQSFVLDAPIMSSVRLKIVKNISVCARDLQFVFADPPCT